MRGRTRRLAILALREVLETPTDAKSAPAKLSAARQVLQSMPQPEAVKPQAAVIVVRPEDVERTRTAKAPIDETLEPENGEGAEEERLWTELHRLVDSLPEDEMEEPG